MTAPYPHAAALGRRHLGDVAGLRPHAAAAKSVRVLVRSGREYAHAPAGQHLLWMLTNLLARQFGHIHLLALDVPYVPVHAGLAYFGAAASLRETLLNVLSRVCGPHVVARHEAIPDADIELHVGPGLSPINQDAVIIPVYGVGWSASIGPVDGDVSADDDSSLGPYFAACLAAGEVFKRARGLLPGKGRYLERFSVSLWTWEAAERAVDLAAGPRTSELELPPTYIVGAGAVGQACCAALGTVPLHSGHLTVIDQDPIDDTNLNRYCLATTTDIGREKAELVAELLAGRPLKVYPAIVRWPVYGFEPSLRVSQPGPLRALEDRFLYQHVLSCVDKNGPRHDVQNFWPEHLLGASTNGLALAVANYDALTDCECLKCHNPVEPSTPSIEQVAEQLRALSAEERVRRAKELGVEIGPIEAYLADPQCGKAGEQEILKFAASATADWSVGFVSVASGTLLAAQHLRRCLLGRPAFPQGLGNTLRYSFLTGKLGRSTHRRSPGCDCTTKGQASYKRQWTPG